MKPLVLLAFALAAFAQDAPPAPLDKTEKKALSTILQTRAELVKQIQAIQTQIQAIDQETNDIVAEVYAKRPADVKTKWNIRPDLTWVKAEPVAETPEAGKVEAKK